MNPSLINGIATVVENPMDYYDIYVYNSYYMEDY
jgi:hypothetical protein